jgi:PAS domain S-box-containing protein
MDAGRWLAALVDSSEDAIVGKTLDGTITSWNAGATRVFGYSAAEAIGQHINFLARPGEEQEMNSLLDVVRHGRSIHHLETTRLHKSGREVVISLSLSPIFGNSGRIIGIAKIARDITERKAAEESRAAEERRLRDLSEQEAARKAAVDAESRFTELLDKAPDAILQIDPSGAILIANRAAREMFGYTAEELQAVRIEALVPEANLARHTDTRHHAEGTGTDPGTKPAIDLNGVEKDGTQFPVSVSFSPQGDGNGPNVTAVIRDATERKESELRVRSLQMSYMAELEARSKEAEESVRLKSEFISSVNHELRTPLHTIVGFAELLAEEANGPLNPKQQKFLQHIRNDAEHLLSLIEDIIDLNRGGAGGLSLYTASLSLLDSVTDAEDSMRPYAKSRSISIRKGSHLDVRVMADPLRLRQILYNLLNNAVKFSSPGGEVLVDAELDGKMVRITVSDTGPGIAPEECAHIFETFYQAGIKATEPREGTGLGLAICRHLVEMQGGTIWVDSRLHQGSQFHFTLPHSV